MPFTFAHPALIIPLLHARSRYRWISATGLIAGSIAPDFEKFFRLQLSSVHSHTVGSIFYFSFPVALGLAFLFHRFIRRPLLDHLPAALYRRLQKYRHADWPGYCRRHPWGVLGSTGLGAALHLLWDGFTHQHTFITDVLPGLASPLRVGGLTVPFFQVVGLLSSTAGLLVVGAEVWRLPVQPVRSVPTSAAVGRFWGIVAVVAFLLSVEWMLAVRPGFVDGGIAVISATLVGLVVASLYNSRFPRTSQKGRSTHSL